MLFDFFKKKEKPIELKQIIAKRKKNSDIHIGQIISIEAEEGKNNYNFYLCKYPDEYISNKIESEYQEICEKYKYAIIKDFNEEKIDARVICCDGYLQRLKIKLDSKYENGSAFIIKENNLYDNNKIVGKIIDNKYDYESKIVFNELEQDRLVVFIRK